MNAEFWKGRKVLVTGHTGFKGSWLALWLRDLGADVAGIALEPPSEPSLFEIARIADGIDDHRMDVRNFADVNRAVQQCQPSVVFHLAAQALVRQGYETPLETYDTNVMGTANVLEAIRQCPSVRAAVIVTSDKCYENRETNHAYGEDEPLGGYDPYSSSKACAEIVTSAYRRSFLASGHAAVATVRAGNVIGGGDWAKDRLVPDLMRAFARRDAASIRNPHAVRPWQHVLEPLGGCMTLARRLADEGQPFATAWNFGPDAGGARTVREIVEIAAANWGTGARWVLDSGDQLHEANLLSLDARKARDGLQWKPHWSLDDSVRETVDWYRAYVDGVDMRDFTLQQIRRFSEACSG
jgi:CDP-glucose 4,6-dehydratase